MTGKKTTELTSLAALDTSADILPIVDVSDTTMSPTGTSKKVSVDALMTLWLSALPTTEPIASNVAWRDSLGRPVLSVGIRPVFTVHPSASTINDGQNVTFTVASNNTTSRQWYTSPDNSTWTIISGQTGLTYTITGATFAAHNGKYFRCVATGPGGSTDSNSALLTVVGASPPVITVQPSSGTIGNLGSHNFTVTATGATSYQWEDSSDNSTFADLAGQTSSTFAITPSNSTAQNGRFHRCVVTGAGGQVVTNAVTLTVLAPSFSALSPQSQTVNDGAAAVFTVVPSNYDTLQWQSSPNNSAWTNIAGETGLTFTIAAVVFATHDQMYYRCVATGHGGVTNSTSALLTVISSDVLPSGSIGNWDGDNFVSAGRYIPNSSSVSSVSTRINRSFRRGFTSNFFTRSGITAVDNAAVGPDGRTEATSFSCTATAWFMNTSTTANFGSQPAGTYTLSVWMKRNTGTDQVFRMQIGSSISAVKTATDTWQQFTFTATLATSFTQAWILHSASTAAELLICDFELFAGASAGPFVYSSGHMFMSPASAVASGEMDFTAANANGYVDFDTNLSDSTRMTVIGLVKKTGTSTGFVPLLAKFGLTGYNEYSAGPEMSSLPQQWWNNATTATTTISTTSFNLLNKGWHVITCVVAPGQKEVWIDGSLLYSDTSASTSITLREFVIASMGNLSSYGQGFKFRQMAAWNRALSMTEIRSATAFLFRDTAVPKTPVNLVITEGDSLTAGATSYWSYYQPNVTPGAMVLSRNQAVGGNTIALNLNLRLPELVKCGPASGSVNRTIVSLLMTNGLTSDTDLFLSEMRTYVDTLRAAGIQVAVATLPPRSTSAHNTYRNIVNPIIRTWPGLGYCDSVWDLAADPTIGTDAAGSNTTYYPDGTHPTTTVQQTYFEPIFRACINGMLL